jgi:hypothetical protein
MTTYDYPTTQLGMVLDAREFLLANGGTEEELRKNQELIDKYSRRPDARESFGDPELRRGVPNLRPYNSTVREAVLGDGTTTTDAFPTPAPRATGGPLAQDNQKGLFRALLARLKGHNPTEADRARVWFESVESTITKAEISPAITRLREHLAAPAIVDDRTMDRHDFADAAPVRNPGAAAWSEWRNLAAKLVEFGGHTGARFAVATDDGARNELAFWWIVPDDRTGRYYLRQVVGGQGATRVRMSPEAMIAIAKKIIAAGPKEAMLRYGQEIGSCGHCGRTLTNDESRAYGIGPVCRKGKGW